MKKLKPIDMTYGAMFVCLMTIGANITIWFPMLAVPIGGTTVPLSLQTFFAILTGLILGRKLGAITMIAYTMLGIAGVPIFAGLSAGPMALISPTGGFIISFIFVAYFVGLISDYLQSNTLKVYLLASFIGLLFNYLIGVSYMYVAMNFWLNLSIPYSTAWISMIPFLIKDGALTGLAALFMLQLTKRLKFTWRTI